MPPYVPGGPLAVRPRYARVTPEAIDAEVARPPSSGGAGGGISGGPRWAGDLMSSLSSLAGGMGRKRLIAGGAGIGGLLAAAGEMGDKSETPQQNLVDATGAGVGSLAALAPLALGMSGPMGWLAAAGLGLAGSQVGKAGLRGATDLVGLTRSDTPEQKAIQNALNANEAGITMDSRRRQANLPIAEQEMALARQNDILRMKADLEARQQAAYAQAMLAMAQNGSSQALGAMSAGAQGILSMPNPY